jgi:hypothetical protein
MSKWKPIETAPKDWTYILGFQDGYGTQITFWDKDHDGGRGGFRTFRHGWSPTHWMELPEPPK